MPYPMGLHAACGMAPGQRSLLDEGTPGGLRPIHWHRSIDALLDCCDGARWPAWTRDMIEPMMYEKQIVPQSIATCPIRTRHIRIYAEARSKSQKHESSVAKCYTYHKRSASCCCAMCLCAFIPRREEHTAWHG